VKLTFLERANLGTVLPKEGDWITLTAVKELKSVIMPTDADLKAIDGEIRPDGGVNFNPSKDVEKDFSINAIQTKIVHDILEKMEKDKKLSESLMSLYAKFVIGGKNV
jgi:hypothetical protein